MENIQHHIYIEAQLVSVFLFLSLQYKSLGFKFWLSLYGQEIKFTWISDLMRLYCNFWKVLVRRSE